MGQLAETAGVQIGYLGELAPTARTHMLHISPPQTTHLTVTVSYRFKNVTKES